MIHHHAGILDIPLTITMISFNNVLNGPGYLPFFFMQQMKLVLHQALPVRQCQYIGWLMHDLQIYVATSELL
jgi:hypothetical protein